MRKIAAALVSAVMLCALLAAPALARDGDDFRAQRSPYGWHEYYRGGQGHEFFENHPQWAWNRAWWREHRGWDDYWHRRDWDDHWNRRHPGRWFHRDYDRR
jgi:hypothetical protein